MSRDPGADLSGLLDHRPGGGDERKVSGPVVVPLQAPRDDGGLVHRRGLPLRSAINRVFLEPEGEGTVPAPHRRQPAIDAAAHLRMPQPRQRVADPDRLAGPAVGAQAALKARGNRSPLGVRMERSGKCSPAQADGVVRLGIVRIRQRGDEAVPLLTGPLLDLVEVGAAEPGQSGPEPVLERAGIAPPAGERAADQKVDGHRRARRQVEPAEQKRFVRAGRLAMDVAPPVERHGELDGRVARQLAVGVAVAAVGRQQGPVAVVPAQAGVADAAVDLGLDIHAEEGAPGLAPLVDHPEPLDVLARRESPAGRAGERVAHGDEIGGQNPDRTVPPAQLGHQEVRRPLVVLKRLPAEPLGEPIEPAADGQAADDGAEVRAALGPIAVGGADVGVHADGREVEVVGRPPGIDPRGHHPIADQSLGTRSDDLGRFGAVGKIRPDDRILGRAGDELGTCGSSPPSDNGAGRRPPGEGWARARGY